MARFKLDENLPAAAEALLQDAGHDVATVIQEDQSGASDLDVHAAARVERRTVVALDRGFGDPRRHPTADTAGIVALRVPSHNATSILSLLRRLLPLFEEQELDGVLWVVEPHRVRIRRGGRQPRSKAPSSAKPWGTPDYSPSSLRNGPIPGTRPAPSLRA